MNIEVVKSMPLLDGEKKPLTGFPLFEHTLAEITSGNLTPDNPDFSYKVCHCSGSLIGMIRNSRYRIEKQSLTSDIATENTSIACSLELLRKYVNAVPQLLEYYGTGQLRNSIQTFLENEQLLPKK